MPGNEFRLQHDLKKRTFVIRPFELIATICNHSQHFFKNPDMLYNTFAMISRAFRERHRYKIVFEEEDVTYTVRNAVLNHWHGSA